jgi:hypothetical protein
MLKYYDGPKFSKPHQRLFCLLVFSSWKNAAPDMLVCTHCHAAWAVVFRSELSATATQHLTSVYLKQLSSAHFDTCFFGKEAAQYVENNAKSAQGSNNTDRFQPIVPTLLARVFSSDLMDSLEHSNPGVLLSARWRNLLTAISSSRTGADGSYQFPNVLQVPRSVLDYRLPLDKSSHASSSSPDNTSHSESSLLTRMVTKLKKVGDGTTGEADLSAAIAESAAAFVLLGWMPCQDATESTNDASPNASTTIPTRMSLECPMCLARMELPLTRDISGSSSSTSESPPPAKRLRQLGLDPVQSHRHYCPYVCGFPVQTTGCGTPIWQSLATRLLCDDNYSGSGTTSTTATSATATAKDGHVHDDAWIRNMLRSAVSPRARQPIKLPPLTN